MSKPSYNFERDGNGVPYTTILEPVEAVVFDTDSDTYESMPDHNGFVLVTILSEPVHFLFSDTPEAVADSSNMILLPGSYYFRVPKGTVEFSAVAVDEDTLVSVLGLK